MNAPEMYKDVLLDHFHHPRNKGDVAGLEHVHRGSNPRCGDELEVGVHLDGERLDTVRFHGRGCSVCIASASMMTEAVTGIGRAQALALSEAMRAWFAAPPGDSVPALPEPLPALAAVQSHPARKRCVLLAWEALADALRSE